MAKKELIAMILAGGQGTRLGVLTREIAKPAVPFGGKYRIIDFTLSNCSNSGIDTVGVLTQYQPLILNSHIGIGAPWDLDRINGGVSILPPHTKQSGGNWYKGTADAIFQNIHFIESYDPDYVLILSGDHIYKMDYSVMLKYHKDKNADATIAVFEVPLEEAGRFGIMNAREDNLVYEFEEKPTFPKSNLASMGTYIFNWPLLKKCLKEDQLDKNSSNDFGKNIIPNMIRSGKSLYTYSFSDYWRDVGTIDSYYESNMDLLNENNKLNIHDPKWKIYTYSSPRTPQYIAQSAVVENSLIVDGCTVFGKVYNSVLFSGVLVGKNTVIRDSVIMSDTKISDNVYVERSIIGNDAVIRKNCRIGNHMEITVVEEKADIKANSILNHE